MGTVYETVCLLILLVTIFNSIGAEPTLDTALGKIRGTTLKSENGNPFYAFRGIPYAKPPLQGLRFKPPEPIVKWNDTLDSTEDGHACLQFDLIRNLVMGDENCLYLNVYTPRLTKNNLRPVMVFIHGGGFNYGEGSSHLYGPERLLDKDIVLVTINYRLSALGFLSTEDEESPGNYGLLDQVEALKWIQNHLDNFGGDPTRVTLFGESAGSASIIYHLLSPLSKGLFHGAICQSGTATNIWAIQPDPLKQTKLLAESLNCPTYDSRKLVECLQKRAALDIMIKSSAMDFTNPMITNPEILLFLPVVDMGYGESEFLREHPESLFKKRQFHKIPVIFGNVKDEGLLELLIFAVKSGGLEDYGKESLVEAFSTISLYPENTRLLDKLTDGYFTDFDSSNLFQRIQTLSDVCLTNSNCLTQINGATTIIPSPMKVTGQRLRVVWSPDTNLNSDHRNLVSNQSFFIKKAFGDVVMNNDLDVTVEALADGGVPTYAYKLTYHGENSIANLYLQHLKDNYPQKLKLVSHGDDLQYLFRMPLFPNELNEQDKQLSDKMITLWTNFAKNKVPSLDNSDVVWQSVQPNEKMRYLNIGNEFRMEEGTFCTKPHLWESLQAKDEL